MLKSILGFSLISIFLSCSNTDKAATSEADLLLSSSGHFIMEDGEKADGYYKNRNQFIKPYTSVSISGDTITATTLHAINGCSEATGTVLFSNDTIYLSVKQDGESCTSTIFAKFTYLIRKPTGKNPVIKF